MNSNVISIRQADQFRDFTFQQKIESEEAKIPFASYYSGTSTYERFLRIESLAYLALTRKTEGRKKIRGRKKMIRMSNVMDLLEERSIKHQTMELLQKTKNREL